MREENAQGLEVAACTTFNWAQVNAIAFDDSKLEMPYFHKSQTDEHNDATNVCLPNGTIVTPGMQGGRTDMVRWIGIYFDRKLSFSHHVKVKLMAAARSLNALRSLICYETGVSPLATRTLYQACVISRSDFGSKIWWTRQKHLASILQSQQNSTLYQILNAFTSTPILTLHNKAAIPPVLVRLQHRNRKFVLRLLSLPPSHLVVQRCPSSFPVPNHFHTSICNPYEYNHLWQYTSKAPSHLIRILCSVSQWVLPDNFIEDTAHLNLTL
jgi:hypothetical protein